MAPEARHQPRLLGDRPPGRRGRRARPGRRGAPATTPSGSAECYGSDVRLASSPGSPRRPRRSSSARRSCRCPARPPAAAAMAGATIDALSGGRFIFGFGPSGPAGLRGLVRRRVREAVGPDPRVHRGRPRDHRPRGPARARGQALHAADRGRGTGQGKALKLNFHPVRNEIPVFVGAIGRKSVEMAAEICDGWIPIFFSPDAFEETWGEHLEAGFEKGGRSRSDLEVSPVRPGRDRRRPRDRPQRRQDRACCSTSAAWAAARRTSTSTSPAASASRRTPARSSRSSSTASAARPTRRSPTSSSTRPRSSAPRPRSPSGSSGSRTAGVDRLIASFVHVDQGERKHTLERLAAIVGAGAPVG